MTCFAVSDGQLRCVGVLTFLLLHWILGVGWSFCNIQQKSEDALPQCQC